MSTKRTEPMTDAEWAMAPEEWIEAVAEDPSCIWTYVESAEERGFRRGIECAARALESPTLPGDLPWPEAAELVRGLLP